MINLYNDDNLNILKTFQDNSMDCSIQDPPYNFKFIGVKNTDWNLALPKKEVWQECFRILKPGSWLIVFCFTRQDILSRVLIDIQNSGFNISFSPIYWCYSSGYPKTFKIDELIKNKIEKNELPLNLEMLNYYKGWYTGFQPKPTTEVIIIAQKPINNDWYVDQSIKTFEDKEIKDGNTNMDKCRIPYENDDIYLRRGVVLPGKNKDTLFGKSRNKYEEEYVKFEANKDGRFPSNLLVCDNVLDNKYRRQNVYERIYNGNDYFSKFFSLDSWWEEKIKNLPKEIIQTFPYMIESKPGKEEKGYYNNHPTVKPIKVISYLMTMFTRKGDKVVDPYMGSGTTGVVSKIMGREFYGMEDKEIFYDISKRRIDEVEILSEEFF